MRTRKLEPSAGVTTDDFFLASAGIWQIDFNDEWQPRLAWLIDFVMAGLRTVSAATARFSVAVTLGTLAPHLGPPD